jgi:hypothetical protein
MGVLDGFAESGGSTGLLMGADMGFSVGVAGISVGSMGSVGAKVASISVGRGDASRGFVGGGGVLSVGLSVVVPRENGGNVSWAGVGGGVPRENGGSVGPNIFPDFVGGDD